MAAYALQEASSSDLVTYIQPDPEYVTHPMNCTELEKSYIINTINGEQGASRLGSILIAQVIRDIYDYASPRGLGWTINSIADEIGSNIFSKSYLKSSYANCSQFAKDAFEYVFVQGGCAYPHKLMNEWAEYLGTGGYALTKVLKLHTYYEASGTKRDAGWVLCNDYSFENTYVNPKAASSIAKGWKATSTDTGLSTGIILPAVETGGSVASAVSMSGVGSYSPEDAVIREFAYLDASYKRVFTEQKMRISVINYIPLVTGLVDALGISTLGYSTSAGADTSDLTGNCKIVVDYLLDKGLNGAASCGIAGNIYHESGFRTDAVGDKGTSFGICQWHNTRGTAMKNFIGSNWKINLTGQLDYLWNELNGSYISVLNFLRSVPDSEAGCRSAADYFVRHFEKPSNVDSASVTRQTTAIGYYNQLKPLSTPGVTSVNMKSRNGTQLSVQKSVQVPADVQVGLCGNYTNYTYWYTRWGWSCRTIADYWSQKGRPSSKGIATVDGHYLIAVTTTFGTTGDLLMVHLVNGESFSAVIGDSKGDGSDSATTIWGHKLGGGVDVIEWEAIGSSTSASGGTNIQLGSWKGVKVSCIDNYGSWLNG